MTLTTLPAVLEPMVWGAAKALYLDHHPARHEPSWEDADQIFRSVYYVRARSIIVDALNAALAAGVARVVVNRPSQFYDEKHEIRISLK